VTLADRRLEDWSRTAERHQLWVRRAAWVVLAAGLLSFVVRGADRPADPSFVDARRRALSGFEEAAFRLTMPDGKVLDWCALLAATEAARQQGLMGQVDLRGYDAMLFRFDRPSTDAFYMYRTMLPLSIAWFDEGGAFVSAAGMDPCRSTAPGDCPVYPAARPYRLALETTEGGLDRLGAVPGATISLTAARCS
jgi:uncharacterized membrane protein (UPF0127 family)